MTHPRPVRRSIRVRPARRPHRHHARTNEPLPLDPHDPDLVRAKRLRARERARAAQTRRAVADGGPRRRP